MFSSNSLFHFLIFKFEATQNNYSLLLLGSSLQQSEVQCFAQEHLSEAVGGVLLFIVLGFILIFSARSWEENVAA